MNVAEAVTVSALVIAVIGAGILFMKRAIDKCIGHIDDYSDWNDHV